MNLKDKRKLADLTPEELERASQTLAWIITTFSTTTLIGIIAPLIQIHVDLDLERLTRALTDEEHASQAPNHQHVSGSNPGIHRSSSDGKMRRQVWYCEACRRVGCIGIDAGENDLFSALCQLHADHSQKSPRCRPRQQQIRVVNPQIENCEVLARSVPPWAINHAAQFLGLSGVPREGQ